MGTMLERWAGTQPSIRVGQEWQVSLEVAGRQLRVFPTGLRDSDMDYGFCPTGFPIPLLRNIKPQPFDGPKGLEGPGVMPCPWVTSSSVHLGTAGTH